MRVRLPVITLIVLLWPWSTVIGQGGPDAPGSVDVTPDGGSTPTYEANTGGHAQLFWVKNNYATTQTYQISCVGRTNVTCTGTDVSQVTLGAGAQIDVMATFSVGAPAFKPGRIVLEATGSAGDTGYVTVPVANPGAPTVALRNHNGDNRDRSLCLTSGAGEAAAWQCGDLLLAHGLPGYATMGRERSLTLLYNSAQAVPKPVITAAVTQGTLAPAAVFVRLSINGVARDSASWTGWAEGTRQIALAHDALPDSSGIYPFSLMVRNVFGGTVLEATVADTLIVVNRAGSLYGAGWALAGVEELRLNQPGNKVLWVGGDGSAKVYRNVATNAWLAAAGGFRDTLRYDPGTTQYTRTLRHGVSVTYSDTGTVGRAKHIRTTNRVGQTTVFAWSKDTLKSITVPPGISGTTYTLTYAGGRLDRITDPAGRILDVTVASNRLTQIIDPDTTVYHTDFAYYAAGRMTGRTTRRGYTTSFVYAKGLRVDTVKVPLNPASGDTARTAFAPWDEQGLATDLTGQIAVDTAAAFTTIFGPRVGVADDASFWVDRWGAAVRIRDPLGFETMLGRGDVSNPALVTRAQFAGGRVLGAGYNGRGNLTFVADSTYEGTGTVQTVVTSYVYGNLAVPDAPTEIRTPVDTTRFRYDTTLGLPDTAIAPGGHRARFEYYTTGSKKGLLYRATELSVSVVDTTAWTKGLQNLATTFVYDASGNDSTVTSPKGSVTRYERDAYHRVSTVWDPLNHRTDYAYDLLNRPTRILVFDSLTFATQYFYSSTGAVDSVLDPRRVKRSWAHNAADQPTQLVDEAGYAEVAYSGPGGLVDSVLTRQGHMIRNRFDAAGRLTATVYPPAFNDRDPPSGPDLSATLPGDSILRTYDAVGRLLTANTSKDTIVRTYNREGTLRTERQILVGFVGQIVADFTNRYWYDNGGRRTKFFTGTDTLRYSYGPDGLLAKLSVQWMPTGSPAPDSILFYWDGLSRRDSLVYSLTGALAYVTFGYDQDGSLRTVCSRHAHDGAVDSDYFVHRVRYTSMDRDAMPRATATFRGGTNNPTCDQIPAAPHVSDYGSFNYDGRHQMRSDGLKTFSYDSSGNRLAAHWVSNGTLTDSLLYTARSNRIFESFLGTGEFHRSFDYDSNGSRATEWREFGGKRYYYYNSIDQMTGHKAYLYDGAGWNWIGSPDRCRYDALGRRPYGCDESGGGWLGFDGDNVIRQHAAYTTPRWRWVQGPQTDDPLIGVYNNGANYQKYFYLTDGRGRLIAFTEEHGVDRRDDLIYTQNGGDQAGAVVSSHTFDNSRAESQSAPKLSFYRNRYYDQETGQFTQEDPIGISGGTNLYSYGHNNPARFLDPFGLCPKDAGGDGKTDKYSDCPPGTEGYRTYLGSMGTVDGPAAQGRRRAEQGGQGQQPVALGEHRGATCKKELAQAGVAVLADALGVSLFRAIGRGARSGTYARGAAYASANGMPTVATHFSNRSAVLAAQGGGHLAVGSVYVGSQVGEALSVDALPEASYPDPRWYGWAKLVPGFGSGAETGEAMAACLLN